MDTSFRPLALVASGLIFVLTACSSTPAAAPADPPPAASSATSPPPSASPAPPADPMHVRVGTPIPYGDEYGKGTITVSDVQVLKPKTNWGGRTIVVATVLWQAEQGEMPYTDSAFTLALADGQRIDALNVGTDDEGLPLHALGSGELSAGKKAKGMIVFDDFEGKPAPDIDGASIEIRQDQQGRSWALS